MRALDYMLDALFEEYLGFRSEMPKKFGISLAYSYLCHFMAKILRLSIKKKRVSFVLHSTFRIFAE